MEYTADYLLESFPEAVRGLACGEGDARDRVRIAHRSIHHLQPEHFPESIRADFEWVRKQLTKRDPERSSVEVFEVDGQTFPVEGLIDANLRKMKNRTAAKIADRIYTIYQKLLAMVLEPREGFHHRLPD